MFARLASLTAIAILCLLPARAEEPSYQMTTYILGLLSKGPNWTPELNEETRKIQDGHMANIRKMAELGKLTVAGPITDGGDLRGIFIFQGVTLDEARAMAEQDPAVKAGRLVLKLHPWLAGKGLRVDPPR